MTSRAPNRGHASESVSHAGSVHQRGGVGGSPRRRRDRRRQDPQLLCPSRAGWLRTRV